MLGHLRGYKGEEGGDLVDAGQTQRLSASFTARRKRTNGSDTLNTPGTPRTLEFSAAIWVGVLPC